MKQQSKLAGLAVLLSVAASPAVAQEKLKIGVIVTLSGPAAVLGQQVRDGFALAVKDLGGKMGGRDVEVVAVDDELKPDGAVTKVKGLLERDKVDFVVGPIFSNILQAIHKPVTDSKTFLISPNAGPSSYAGKNCSPFFYVTSYQNDQVFEILGKVAQDRGYKRVYLLVPNYQAGKDSAAGFKLDYKGEIVEETYMPLGALDFQVELSKIASLKPDAVFTFMPGAALKKADFTSLRGGFKFNTNGYPIQDFYLTKVAKRPDGKFQTEIVEKVFEKYGDRYAKDCTPGN